MQPPGSRPLSAIELALLSARVEHFRAAMAGGDPGDWELFLTGLSPRVRVAVLTELAILDLIHCWDHGDKPRVEDYLARFPELGPDDAVPVALVVEEYRCRLKAGEPPDPEQYRTRFPARFAELRVELAAVRSLKAGTVRGTPTLSNPAGGPANQDLSGAFRITTSVTSANQYERVRKLGEGAFGEVWEVVKHPSGIRKAMKIPFQPADGRSAQREIKALEAVKNLRHPCLLGTEDFWVEDNKLHVVMELADCTLRGRLEACRAEGLPGIPPDELIGYLIGSAKGLDFLHHPGGGHPRVIHRDVKPDNILILQGEAKVADFGLARQQEQSLAQQSMFAGTLLYMAPEVYAGDAGTASDQYSLAFTYAEVRQGRPPIPAGNFAELLEAVQAGSFDFDECLGDAEREVVRRALARRPKDRYASCSEFARELAAALGYNVPGTGAYRVPSGVMKRPGASQAGAGTADNAKAPTRKTPPDLTETFLPESRAEPPPRTATPAGRTPPRAVPTPSLTRRPPKPASRAKLVLAVGLTVALLAVTGGVVWLLFFGGGGAPIRPTATTATPTTPAPTIPSATQPTKGETKPTGPTPTAKVKEKEPDKEPPLPPPRTRPEYLLPPGAEMGPEATVVMLADGRKVPNIVVFQVSGEPVPFRLITAVGPPVEPFYVGESKVWNKLYKDAALEKQLPVNPRRTEPGGPDAPAVEVTAEEAEAFARKVFGGHLPTRAEWDAAAGFRGQQGQRGPTLPSGQPRVNKKEPLPTRGRGPEAGNDVTESGVRDMAGNGREWTRDVLTKPGEPSRLVGEPPLGPTDLVILRGRAYYLTRPLTYDILKKEQDVPQTQFGTVASPYTGFRVAVPVPK